MTLLFVIELALFALAGLANSGMDAIKFKPKTFLFQSDWWLSRGDHLPGKRTWLTRYVLFFLADGWHLLKLIMVLAFVAAVVVAMLGPAAMAVVEILIRIAALYGSFSLSHLGGYYWFWDTNEKI